MVGLAIFAISANLTKATVLTANTVTPQNCQKVGQTGTATTSSLHIGVAVNIPSICIGDDFSNGCTLKLLVYKQGVLKNVTLSHYLQNSTTGLWAGTFQRPLKKNGDGISTKLFPCSVFDGAACRLYVIDDNGTSNSATQWNLTDVSDNWYEELYVCSPVIR